jgi:hypothetical protein
MSAADAHRQAAHWNVAVADERTTNAGETPGERRANAGETEAILSADL